ncbi:Acb2/Tad1 domain-containing protein [Paenibacillus sp. FSL L8-0708]|uniref:Acb2/Tad1 domain-containing protein n=1 Tax=Paenibacillus sp. FSL L8-0708 TaxID=2975311 RepID=UPI0030FA8484
MSNPQIENNFSYHAPKPGQPEIYEEIRNKARELAELIDEKCPKSRESSLAMTNLEQSVMWANAAVARN